MNIQRLQSHMNWRLRHYRKARREGSILVLSAILMIVFISIAALSVDLGYINGVQTELDRAVDAAALASAGNLIDGVQEATNAAEEYVARNNVGSGFSNDFVEVEVGQWNDESQTFIPSPTLPSAVRVRASRNDQRPLFFGRVLNREAFPIRSEAVAMYQPRDIMLVLDYSGSMNDDSEFKSFDRLGRESVESNLALIYTELGAPAVGSLQMAPQYMVVAGQSPGNSHEPQLFVEYRYDSVLVSSTKPFHKIRVYRNGSSYNQSTSSGTFNSETGVYEVELSYNNNQIKRVYVESGYNNSNHNNSNKYSEDFYFDTTNRIRQHAKDAFGLDNVSWPYPSGSWNSYIDYVTSSSGQNADAGYRYKFGYLNWVNYLLQNQEAFSETPVLWQTSEYPITAVKNAVTVFMSYLQEVDTNDKMGLSVYNSPSGDAVLEQSLTLDFAGIEEISRQRPSRSLYLHDQHWCWPTGSDRRTARPCPHRFLQADRADDRRCSQYTE